MADAYAISEKGFNYYELPSQAEVIDSSRIQPRQIQAGSLSGTAEVFLGGSTDIKIDGPNRRILISDGENDRVLLGQDIGGF